MTPKGTERDLRTIAVGVLGSSVSGQWPIMADEAKEVVAGWSDEQVDVFLAVQLQRIGVPDFDIHPEVYAAYYDRPEGAYRTDAE